MEDRFIRGFFAGILGGVITNAASFLEGATNLTTIRTADLISIIIYAHEPPFGLGEIVFALLGHIFVCGVLGAGFAYWVTKVTSRSLWLKGWFFSVAVYFSLYSLTTLFEVPGTVPTPLNTIISDAANTTIFGISLAFALQALTPQESKSSSLFSTSMAPAMKPLDGKDDEKKQP